MGFIDDNLARETNYVHIYQIANYTTANLNKISIIQYLAILLFEIISFSPKSRSSEFGSLVDIMYIFERDK